MGIPYLTKLVTSQDVYRDELFGAGPLVIDGSGLVYQLYFSSDTRAKQRIHRAHEAAENGMSRDVLPTLIWEVFRQTLDSLGVSLARTYTEADRQAAALAHEFVCPVLSNDTDFFIFPMNGGMLPFKHFRWSNVLECGQRRFIPCKRYFSSRFCEVNQIPPQLLPIFAVMAGNDYVEKPLWTEGMCSLLQWIRSVEVVDPLQLLKTALKNSSQEQTEEQLRTLQEVASHYNLPSSSSLGRFFCEGTTPPLPPQMVEVVPDWMRDPVTRAQFSSDFLDVVTLQRVGLSVVVDHKDKPSANLVSLPLRRVLYGLLLGKDGGRTVEERDRDGLEVKYNQVQPDAELPFCVKTLQQAAEEQRRQVLLDALGLDQQFGASLPSHLAHLTLPLAATCYWLKKATPPPPMSLLKALLIGWCKGGSLRSRADKDPDSKKSLYLDWCHWLNQWQSCLRDSFLLNQLLGGPLPQPIIAQLYNGRLIHVLLHKMWSGRLEHFVPPGTCSDKDYCDLLDIAQTHTGRILQEPAAPNQPPAPPLCALPQALSEGPFALPLKQPWELPTLPNNGSQTWGPSPLSQTLSQPWACSAPHSQEPLTLPLKLPRGTFAPPPQSVSQPWGPSTLPNNGSQARGPVALPLKPPRETSAPPQTISQPWGPSALPNNGSQPWGPVLLPLKPPWELSAPPQTVPQPWGPFALPQMQPQGSSALPNNGCQTWVSITVPLKQLWEHFASSQKSSQPWGPVALPLKQSWENSAMPKVDGAQPWEAFAPHQTRSQSWEPPTPSKTGSQPLKHFPRSQKRSQPWETSKKLPPLSKRRKLRDVQ
ncbi:hypothetical protein WMY93_026046 [Mugilogobius chulae]|uniref:Asteroid domain-containing protein n=1 Tax=Mugilogobius chulae TaxID=88201 RepID=A0AAW0N0N5_9GOBI